MSSPKYEPTPEQLERWAKLDELEISACTGKPLSEEEIEFNINRLFDKNYYHYHLEEVRANKQKLIKKLEYLSQREQILLAQIQKEETNNQTVVTKY